MDKDRWILQTTKKWLMSRSMSLTFWAVALVTPLAWFEVLVLKSMAHFSEFMLYLSVVLGFGIANSKGKQMIDFKFKEQRDAKESEGK